MWLWGRLSSSLATRDFVAISAGLFDFPLSLSLAVPLSLSLSPSLLHSGLLISYNVTEIKYFRVIEVCFVKFQSSEVFA